MTYWFFAMPRLIFMLAPLTFIIFDIKIFVSNLDEALAYTSTYIVVNLMLQNYLYGNVRWPLMSELYEYLQGVFLAKAIVAVAMNPRKPTFNVTAKGLTLDNNHLSELAWPFFAIYGVLFLGSAVAMWRYHHEPEVAELMLVVGLWNCFNLLVAGAALGAVAERSQPDRHPRLTIARKGVLFVGAAQHSVSIVNVSAGGCGVVLDEGALKEVTAGATPALLSITPMGSQVTAQETLPLVYRHSTHDKGVATHGFEFGPMAARDYYVLADLMYADSDALPRFLMSRRKHKNVLVGMLRFAWWGVSEPVRALRYALQPPAPVAVAGEQPPSEPATVWLHRILALGRQSEAASGSASDTKAA